MNAKSIETQIEANNRETAQIQQQLSQMPSNAPLRQQLNNRLEMIRKSQDYWKQEYFKLTGTQLKTNPPPNTVQNSPQTIPNAPNNAKEDSMAEWKTTRENIRKSMIGNPHYLQIENYLNQLEKTYGDQIPKHSGGIVFGKGAILNGLTKIPKDFNGTLVENSAIYFDEEGAAVIFLDGSTIKPVARTMIQILKPIENKGFPGPMVSNPNAIKDFLKALRGE